jgi:pimeloyl-ACP methyl ester carboxylesterase
VAACTGLLNQWTTTQLTSNFVPDLDYCNFLIDIGFGKHCDPSVREFWQNTIQGNSQGDDGRCRARMAAINLRERDGLHGRLFGVRCPVMWLYGDADVVYSVKNAQEEIKMFSNAKSAELVIVPNGQHFLSASHPEVVDADLITFVTKWANRHI